MKNSFVIYTEWLEQIESLPPAERGILFSAIIRHVSGKELPSMDPVTEMAFSFIRAVVDRDTAKYEEITEKRRMAGRARAEQMVAHAESADHKKHMTANEGVNVNDNENVNVNDKYIARKRKRTWINIDTRAPGDMDAFEKKLIEAQGMHK